jgi:hypothetical protein
MIKPRDRGVLDPPHARGMTVFYGAARCVFLAAWIAWPMTCRHFFTSGQAGSGGPNASSPEILVRIL